MSRDDSPERPNSNEHSPEKSDSIELSAVTPEQYQRFHEISQEILQGQTTILQNHQILWDRVTWLLKLESSRADHTLTLATAIEKDRAARDRQTEAVLALTRQLDTLSADVNFTKEGINALHSAISVERAAEKAVKRAVREATGRHRKLTPEEVGKVGAVTKVIAKFLDAPPRAQVLLLIAIAMLLLAVGGWSFVALHKYIEDPRGVPVEQEHRGALPPSK